MLSNLPTKTPLFRTVLTLFSILSAILPIRSWAEAQSNMAYFSNPHFIYTSEYGIVNPEGMAFSPDANAFVVWQTDQNANAISAYEELVGKVSFPQNIGISLDAAFDNYSKSLFILDLGNMELSKVPVERNGLPDSFSTAVKRFDTKSFELQDTQGITFDPATGRLFILDAGKSQILMVSASLTRGFDGAGTAANNQIRRLNLRSLSSVQLRGIAFNPDNQHLYIGSPTERRVYEITETGKVASTYDVSDLSLENPSTMLFAPSRDGTDNPNVMNLFILDEGQSPRQITNRTINQEISTQKSGQIVELSLLAATGLPSGTSLLPSTLVNTIDTSIWNNPSPDPSGIDYWPLTGSLLISDSEIEEPVGKNSPAYWHGFNVFQSTLAGSLSGNCTTFTSSPTSLAYNNFTGEPSGLATNPDNNHIFFSQDDGANDKVFEIGIGSDGIYCTSDDIVTSTDVASLYGATDAEDVAYGNNMVCVASGIDAEVFCVPLGPNGILGGGDDGPMTHFDTAVMGFHDLEGIDFNADSGTLFIVSTQGNENYLGETTISGTLLRAYDLSFMGTTANLRSDVSYAPSSQNPANKNIYIVSRGIDNNTNRLENDGKVWEISLGSLSPTSTPTTTLTSTPSPTPTITPMPSQTPTVTTIPPAHVSVSIGGALRGSYDIPSEQIISPNYPINDGPAHVISTNGQSIFTSERVIYGSSFNSIVGYPGNQLTTDYWFTSYDDAGMITYLVICNPSTSQTAQVDVYIGGNKMEASPYSIAPGQRIFPRYGINAGPVHVVSTNGVNIFTSERTKFGNSFNEVMGYPGNQLTTEYWFTSYDDTGMITYMVIGNPHTSNTAEVDVYIAGTLKGHYSIAPGQRVFPRYGINSGPVRVVSTNGVDIFSSERTKFGQTFNEVLGFPGNQVSSEFWFTSYDDTGMITYLVVGNPDPTLTAQVDVYIGGVKKNATPYQIAPGQRMFQRYGVNAGPIRVVSTNGVNVFASERSKYLQSFNEILGLADNQLTTDYWFTSYDDVGMDTKLVIGAAQ